MCKAVDGAFRASHALLKFLKLVAKQEGEYARAVLGSSRDDKKLFQLCNGTAGAALLSLFSSTAAGAAERQTYAHALRDTVCAALAERLETLGAELKAAESDGARSVSEKAGAYKARTTSKLRGGPSAAADAPPPEEVVEHANRSLAAVLSNLRNIERRRANAVGAAVRQYVELTRTFLGADSARVAQIETTLAAVNVDEDELALCAKIVAEAHAEESAAASAAAASAAGANIDDDGNSGSHGYMEQMRRNLDRMKNAFSSSSSSDGNSGSSSSGTGSNGGGGIGQRLAAMVKKSTSSGQSQQDQQQQDQDHQQGGDDGPGRRKKPKLVNTREGVLGVGLEEFMARQRGLYPALDVPLWLVLFRDTFARMDGTAAEGLFRLSGGQHAVDMYKEMLCAPLRFASAPGAGDGSAHYFRVVKMITTVHVMTSVFKGLLRELPVPVVPPALYSTFVDRDFCKSLTTDNFEERVLARIEPACHRNTFVFLIGYAQYLTRFADATKMGAANLAMILGPCLLRCPCENPALLLQYYDTEKAFVQACITLLPERRYTALNTAVAVRPDGSRYSGRGFEYVRNDPLTAKYDITVPDDDNDSDYNEDAESGQVGDAAAPPVGAVPAPAAESSASQQQQQQQLQPPPTRPPVRPPGMPSAVQAQLTSELTQHMASRSASAASLSTKDSGSGAAAAATTPTSATGGPNQLALKQMEARQEMERIRTTYASVATALRHGGTGAEDAQALVGATEALRARLAAFAESALQCTPARLAAVQSGPAFRPLAPALQPAPVAECGAAVHALLLLVDAELRGATAAADVARTGDALHAAGAAYASAVAPHLPADATIPPPLPRMTSARVTRVARSGSAGAAPPGTPPQPTSAAPRPPVPAPASPLARSPAPVPTAAGATGSPLVAHRPSPSPSPTQIRRAQPVPVPAASAAPAPVPMATPPVRTASAPAPMPVAPPVEEAPSPGLTPEETAVIARLQGLQARVVAAREQGERLVEQFEQNRLSRQDMADFVRRVKPFVAYERDALAFVQRRGVPIEPLAPPVGDPESLQMRLQLLVHHLSKCAMLLDCTAYFLSSSHPLEPPLLAAAAALADAGAPILTSQ